MGSSHVRQRAASWPSPSRISWPPTLTPAGQTTTQWAHAAFDGWWAASGFGAAIYCSFIAYGLYLITQQNMVGFLLIKLLWDNRGRLEYAADEANADGHWGWGSARAALSSVYAELAVHGLGLACVFATLTAAAIRGPASVAWVQWAVVLPLYLVFPFFLVRRTIKRFKDRRIAQLLDVRARAGAQKPKRRVRTQHAVDVQIDRVRSIPILPFRAPKDVGLFTISLAADSAAVYALIQTFILS